MFENTNDFFEKITENNIPQIDIVNYVKSVTKHDLKLLEILKRDLNYFIAERVIELDRFLTKEDYSAKEKYYQDKGESIPMIDILNGKLSVNGEPEYNSIVDTEKAFHFVAMFHIRQLQAYIEDLIKTLSESVPVTVQYTNTFPLVFSRTDNKAFELFDSFAKQYVTDPYKDFSYLFQQMKIDGLIVDIKQKAFMNWLSENKYIGEEDYQDFLIKDSLASFKNCNSKKRRGFYNKLKDAALLT